MGRDPTIYIMGNKSFLSSYVRIIPGLELSGRNTLFNLTLIVDWRVITTKKKLQADINNANKNSRRDLVYVDNTGIYRNVD